MLRAAHRPMILADVEISIDERVSFIDSDLLWF
jgi:hypothetical protein